MVSQSVDAKLFTLHCWAGFATVKNCIEIHTGKEKHSKKKLKKSQSSYDPEKYRALRRETKKLVSLKKKDYNKNLTESLFQNPKRFWSALKSSKNSRQAVTFLRNDDAFTTDKLTVNG